MPSRILKHLAGALFAILRQDSANPLRQLYNQPLLTAVQRDLLDVVLVSPRNPLNIGASARALANFGFARLSVVAPFAPTWREARSAVGAPDLLHNATEFASLTDAVSGCALVLGTGTLTYRKPEQPVLLLPQLAPLVSREVARGGRIALVFGPEKHGLTREDLSYCHFLVKIPTDAGQPSMNLGQAVAVCLYELASRAFLPENGPPEAEAARNGTAVGQDAEKERIGDQKGRSHCPKTQTRPEFAESDAGVEPRLSGRKPHLPTETGVSAALSGQLDLLAGVVEDAMRAMDSSPRSMQQADRRNLRLLLRRLSLSERDARRILGLFRRILWRLNHIPSTGDESG
jgi:tRNA/rRNA methyltransferase